MKKPYILEGRFTFHYRDDTKLIYTWNPEPLVSKCFDKYGSVSWIDKTGNIYSSVIESIEAFRNVNSGRWVVVEILESGL